MPQLRDYQKELLDNIEHYLITKNGNPCVVLSTGAGKSWVIAELIHHAIERDASSRVLMVTHQKELIEQDYDKLIKLLPDADVGIYSASVGQKDLTHRVTFAGIQSIIKAKGIPSYSLMIVDECHLINNNETGSYRKLEKLLRESRA